MPATPLHYPLAYVLYRLSSRRLDLPALVLGASIPDLEVAFFELMGLPGGIDRLVLHSIFGALILCPFLVFLFRSVVYAPFAQNILCSRLSQKRSVIILFSGMFGTVSHILLDLPMHPYNPLLWPFSANSVNILNEQLIDKASAVIHLFIIIMAVVILVALASGARDWKTYLRRLLCD